MFVEAEDLARTYGTPGYADSWEGVQDYQRYLRYAGEHPQMGSYALSRVLDLPRGRLRAWEEGARPDVVKALEIAEENRWIDLPPGSERLRGFNVFVSWIFSGGSISRKLFTPHFAVNGEEDVSILEAAADEAGVGLLKKREAEERRAEEYTFRSHASLLGRILHVLGAPLGVKNRDIDLSLPEYLDDSSFEVRRDFVKIYVHNRGAREERKDTVCIREERKQGYLEELRGLIQRVVGGDSLTISDRNIIIKADTARQIQNWPPVLRRKNG